MNVFDVIGYMLDGACYCTNCADDFTKKELEESSPIFAGEEVFSTVLCDECGDIILEVEEKE